MQRPLNSAELPIGKSIAWRMKWIAFSTTFAPNSEAPSDKNIAGVALPKSRYDCKRQSMPPEQPPHTLAGILLVLLGVAAIWFSVCAVLPTP